MSFVASSTIAAMIIRSNNGLRTPYSRIIFGLSIADIMQSLGIIISPLAAPSGTLDAPWAMGSTGFCSATGFVLNVGGVAVPLYTLLLTHYFLQRVKYKLTPAQFASKMECRISILVWLYPVIGGLVGLVNGYFNPGPNGSLCMMIDKPLHCNVDPKTYGDCARGQNASLASLFLTVLPFVFSFAMVIINLVRFTLHVYQQEQMFKPTTTSTPTRDSGDGTPSSSAVNHDIESSRRRIPDSLAKQSLVQSGLYITSFFICYFAPTVAMIMSALRMPPPAWLFWCVSIFWPLGGFFNILIYTRPKVSRYKDSNPEYSKLYVFLIIVLSGGEVPTEIDFGDIKEDSISTSRIKRERARALEIICENINEYHANKANEGSSVKLSVLEAGLDSMPSARVKSQDSYYKEVLQMNSFAERCSLSSSIRNDNDHSYGIEVTGVNSQDSYYKEVLETTRRS